MKTATPRVWLAAAPWLVPQDLPVVRDHLGRCWRPALDTDCYCTGDGRHHIAWRELRILFDLVEVA